jgi:hypothetical protein
MLQTKTQGKPWAKFSWPFGPQKPRIAPFGAKSAQFRFSLGRRLGRDSGRQRPPKAAWIEGGAAEKAATLRYR